MWIFLYNSHLSFQFGFNMGRLQNKNSTDRKDLYRFLMLYRCLSWVLYLRILG